MRKLSLFFAVLFCIGFCVAQTTILPKTTVLPGTTILPGGGAPTFTQITGPQTVIGAININDTDNAASNKTVFFTPATTNSLTSVSGIWMWLWKPDAANSSVVGIYPSSGSAPSGSLICSASLAGGSKGLGWNFITLSGCGSLSASTLYFAAYISASTTEADNDGSSCPDGMSSYHSTSPQGSGTVLPASVPAVTADSGFCAIEAILMMPSTSSAGTTALTATQYLNFSSCSAGSACSSANLASSVYGTNGGWSAGMSGGETAIANPFPQLPRPVTVGGTTYTGTDTGTLAWQCSTSGSGSSCPSINLAITATGAGTLMAVGYWISWTCPEGYSSGGSVLDCGDIGGISGNGGDYVVFHVNSCSTPGNVVIEVNGAADCTPLPTAVPSTIYRVNLLYTQGATGPKKFTICDQYLNVLATQSSATGTGSHAPYQFSLGFFGEEPLVAGYLLQQGAIVVDSTGALYSASSCF